MTRSPGRTPPRAALVSSAAAPVFLVGGWVVAQAVQPDGYDPVRQTISALARHGLDHRWIMTLGLAGLGVCHVVTALGLPSLRPASRVLLATGGAATLLVSVFAQPFTGSSATHIVLAVIGFVTLALWPATTTSRTPGTPRVIAPLVAATATVVSVGLLIWVGLAGGDGRLGLAERLLTAEQALWPLVVVVGLRTGRAARIAG